jgi:putative hemolysin
VILVTVILSFFTLVFGELVPKRVAMQKSEVVARYASGMITVLTRASRPVIWILTAATNGMLRLFKIDPNENSEDVSEEEILYLVDVGEEKGAIEASEKEMIANIFEFNNMTAEDVMVHRTDMEVVHIDDTEEEILEKIRQSGYSRLPVCGEEMDDIRGILMARDFLLNIQCADKKPIGELLRPPYFVPESVRTDVLFRNMQSNKTHLAIVVDEYGGVSGLVTIEDLLEEIVGNIYDESDLPEVGEITQIGEGVWRVAGSAPLVSVAEELKVALPESDEFDTLSGLVMDHLGAVPEDGASPEINVYGLSIQVEQMKDRRVEYAIVSKKADLIQE